MILVPNKRVACEPFSSLAMEQQGKTFVHVKEKTSLFPLKVLFETSWTHGQTPYHQDDIVWVRGDTKVLQWAKDVFEVQGKKFILVPEEYIQLRSCGSMPEEAPAPVGEVKETA